jgi:hypothetical protein
MHWNDCLTISGEYNLAAIVKIAHTHAKADAAANKADGFTDYPYSRNFASHLRTAWQVARGYHATRNQQVAA